MFNFPSFGEFVAMFAIIAAVVATVAAVGLKLWGVLLLSWTAIFAPLGVIVLLCVFAAVVLSVFGK